MKFFKKFEQHNYNKLGHRNQTIKDNQWVGAQGHTFNKKEPIKTQKEAEETLKDRGIDYDTKVETRDGWIHYRKDAEWTNYDVGIDPLTNKPYTGTMSVAAYNPHEKYLWTEPTDMMKDYTKDPHLTEKFEPKEGRWYKHKRSGQTWQLNWLDTEDNEAVMVKSGGRPLTKRIKLKNFHKNWEEKVLGEAKRPMFQDTPNEFAYLDFKKWAYKNRSKIKKKLTNNFDGSKFFIDLADIWRWEWAKNNAKEWSYLHSTDIAKKDFGRALAVMMKRDNLIIKRSSNSLLDLK